MHIHVCTFAYAHIHYIYPHTHSIMIYMYMHTHAHSDFGLYDDVHYKCKWFSPLDKLSVVEPDYSNDIWDYVVKQGIMLFSRNIFRQGNT